ncbi:MAG: hypothetical protein JWL77_259 [Chthonomonadaceae bacterium]|nr:hypothetical protein [Chthonomonadaceae bacterium]
MVTYNGSGLNAATGDALSYSAEFSINFPGTSGSQLQIKLINTMNITGVRGDLLSGVFFNLSGVSGTPFSGTSSDVFTALVSPVDPQQSSLVINSDNSAAGSQTVAGSYAFGDFTGVSGSQFNYGVNATQFSGGNPSYAFSGQALGGAFDAYTIRPNTSGALPGDAVPVIQNEVLLTLNGFGSGLTSTSQLSNVYFAAGSGAQTVGASQQYILVQGTPPVPEPDSVGLLGGLAASGGLCLLRRRRKRR